MLALNFGSYMRQPRRSKIEVLDQRAMRARWLEVRMEEWRANNHGASPDIEARAKKHYGAMIGGMKMKAFAYKGVVYISPTLPENGVVHEVIHTKQDPASTYWLATRTDLRTANDFNESLTEHFNKQLTGGVGRTDSIYSTQRSSSAYGMGTRVLEELRDERLGGAEAGEEALRRFHFGGDTAELDQRLAASGGSSAFFDEYRTRLDAYTAGAKRVATKQRGGR